MALPKRFAAVATVLDPVERPRLDAAAQGCFQTYHATSVQEVIRTVRERSVSAVLLSPNCIASDQLPGVANLVRGFPGVSTVAVVSRHDATQSQRLLELGASGVRKLVDVSARDGWRRLREVVSSPTAPTVAKILGRLIPALGDCTGDCRKFFDVLVRLSPGVPTVRGLTRYLRVHPSTFMSRFFRAGIPSPKRYLSGIRLVHAAFLFESGELSVSDVAYRLEYSSPQSFGRHIKAVLGLTASEYRRRYPFRHALDDYVDHTIVPFRATFRTFHPLNNRVADFGHHS